MAATARLGLGFRVCNGQSRPVPSRKGEPASLQAGAAVRDTALPFPDRRPHPQPGSRCAARSATEARVSGTQDRRYPTPAPLAEPSPEPYGAPVQSASLSSAGRKLSNLVRSKTVRASAGRCVRPGLAGVERGFSSLEARIERRAWVSPRPWRRRAGSVALPGECASGGWIRAFPGSQTHPAGFSSCPLLWGCCEKGRPRCRTQGLPGRASECVLRPWGAASRVPTPTPRKLLRSLSPGGAWGLGAAGPGVAWGRGWAASEVSREWG